MVAETQKESQSGIKFFGNADLNEKGKVKSEYPSWYFDVLKDDLKESIRYKANQLDMGLIPQSEMPFAMESLKKERKRLEEIEESRPKFSGQQKDKMNGIRSSLGDKIAESMFTKTYMMKGLANPHDEAKRMATPVIALTPEEAEVASACEVKIGSGRKVSRNSAEKIWKILGRALGEETNTESLRRD